MKTSKFDVWIKKILATEAEEISCSECFDLVSDYVDAEASGEQVQPESPQGKMMRKVKHHLGQCQVCMEEYEVLRDLVRMESGDGETGLVG